ncbi:hypothetical protein PtA15_10A17 [Puccinia triticina]|uniref:Uncharacterized protein n=1 Tax=Puccinia triticina TaxID=208348 RepID=A0ABY7CTI8_9BASI|nr:uncharacterized protein PtA15_10A17 [Puccinia triticina]WAQ88598.1 hypothetical protein PtA15_10A17 [Puccinia triticina]
MNSGAGGEPREGGEERRARRLYPLLQTLASLALLLDLHIFFLVSIVPTLLRHYPGLGPSLVALFAYLWLLAISSMDKTVSLDPGIQPRGLDLNPEMVWKPAPIDPAEPIIHPHPPPVSHENNAKPLEYNQQPVPLDFLSDKEVSCIQSKLCTTCESYRPPRSSHFGCVTAASTVINHHCSYLNEDVDFAIFSIEEIPSPLRLFAESHNNILSLSPLNSGLIQQPNTIQSGKIIENVGWASESCILESTQSMRTVNINGFLLENLILSPLDEASECLDLEDLTTVKVLLLAFQSQPIT